MGIDGWPRYDLVFYDLAGIWTWSCEGSPNNEQAYYYVVTTTMCYYYVLTAKPPHNPSEYRTTIRKVPYMEKG